MPFASSSMRLIPAAEDSSIPIPAATMALRPCQRRKRRVPRQFWKPGNLYDCFALLLGNGAEHAYGQSPLHRTNCGSSDPPDVDSFSYRLLCCGLGLRLGVLANGERILGKRCGA